MAPIVTAIAVALVSALALWRWLVRRRREQAAIAYVTSHGIIVRDDGGVVPPRAEMEREVERVLSLYRDRVPADLWRASTLDGLYVRVQDRAWAERNGVGGWYQPGSGINIWLDGRPLDDTPLAHELGNALTFRDANPDDVRKEYGVP